MRALSAIVVVVVSAASACAVLVARPGDTCTRDNQSGVCTRISRCVEVIHRMQQNRTRPRSCYKSASDPLPYVCCLDRAGPGSGPGAVRGAGSGAVPGPAGVPEPTAPTSQGNRTGTGATTSAQITERLARKKCREYAKLAFVMTTSPGLVMRPATIPVDKCVKAAEGLIVGGINASLGEFPHMALLGYGDDPENLIYDCGGSLISEEYVLTASHCIVEQTPTYVLLGDLILGDSQDHAEPQLIPIASAHDRGIILHPQYQYPSHYYDVALIRLARRPTLGPMLRPACLHTGEPYSEGSLLATGWGSTEFGGDRSDSLMKVNLNEVDFERCNKTFGNLGAKLRNGIRNEQQICAGRLEGGYDTCQGDSGGPLQAFRQNPYCTYDVVGVVSFGRGCALRNAPGVYARVQHFIDWIESIVWPTSP